MPFNSSLPVWNKTAVAPSSSKQTAGWGANEKPPASIFNWFFNTVYLALQELQQEAINIDQKGINNGVATLDATGDLPIGQADNILNWVKGFGLGDVAKDITSTDLNVLDSTGFYTGTTMTNAPTTGRYYIINVKYTTAYKAQIAITTVNSGTVIYHRNNNNGTWGTWTQFATYDTSGKIAITNLPAATTAAAGIAQLNDTIASASTTQAATANSVKQVMDFVKGAGLGDVAKDVTGTDLNNLDTTGFYKGNTLTNGPTAASSGTWYFIIHTKHDSGHKAQIAMRYGTSATTGQVWQRLCISNTWQAWVPFASSDLAQMTKITSDTGGVKLSVSDTAKNLLTELVNLGQGIHTFYCYGTVPGNPSTKSVRGIAHFTGTTIGWVWCTDYDNNLFTNYYDTGNAQGGWRGWRAIANADLAQMWKLTQDNGYVIDSTAETDINNLSMVGFYNTNNTAANLPTSEFYKIITLNSSSNTITQIAVGNNTGAMYTRNKKAGVWAAWIEFAKLSSNGQLSVPNQSNISALKSGGTLNLTSGVDTKLTSFITEYRDTQNEFNLSTGEITIKENGVYLVEGQAVFSSVLTGNAYVKLYRNGVAWITITGGTSQSILYGQVQAQCVAGDILSVYVVQSSGSTGGLSSFKLELIKIS